MIEADLALQKPLEDYVEHIDNLNMRSVFLFSEMFVPSISFSDPYIDIKGASNMQSVFDDRFKLYPDARYKIIDFVWGRREAMAYIYWSFVYMPKNLFGANKYDVASNIDIICEVKFLPDGRVYSHTEFWGKHAEFDIKAYKRLTLSE